MFPYLRWLETPYYSTGDKLRRCLPALRALTGFDTTSKTSTKHAAMKAIHNRYRIFNNLELTESMIQTAENYLVRYLKPTKDLEAFDDLRLAAFNSNSLKIDFEMIPCTSANARKHIQRTYYHQQLWIQAPLKDGLEMNTKLYGFKFLVLLPPSLKTFLILVHVVNVATRMICRCRVAGIKCCKYCK